MLEDNHTPYILWKFLGIETTEIDITEKEALDAANAHVLGIAEEVLTRLESLEIAFYDDFVGFDWGILMYMNKI